MAEEMANSEDENTTKFRIKSNKVIDEKKLRYLKQQRERCLEADKLANDDDRVNYENSSVRMRTAISILKQKENESMIQTYAADFKKAFGISDSR